MLHPLASMRVALDAKPSENSDFLGGSLGKAVFGIAMNTNNTRAPRHHGQSLSRYHFVITYFTPLRTFIPW